MVPLRPLRRVLLISAAVAVILLAACAPAFAADPAGTPNTPPAAAASDAAAAADTTALALAAITENKLQDAQRMLARVVAEGRSEEERAAAMELRIVVDRWIGLGRTIGYRDVAGPAQGPGGTGRGRADVIAVGDAWEAGFAVARERLVAGQFDDASADFAVLLGGARDRRSSLRAYALAALASDLVGKGLALREPVAPQTVAGRTITDYHRSRRGAPVKHWYGWQTLIADGASLIVVPLGAAAAGSPEVAAGAFIGGYLLAAPIIHFAHGRPGIAAASFGLRLGMPLLGAAAGALADGCGERGEWCVAGPVIGMALGMLGAVVLDASLLTYENEEDDDDDRDASITPSTRHARHARHARRAAPPPRPISFVPSLAPRLEGGFNVGVAAVF